MTLTGNKVNSFTFQHANQPDRPNTVFPSTAAFKTALDSQAAQLQTGLNGTIDNLVSVIPGNSGSENIGSAPVSGVVGATVYQQMGNLKTQLDAAVIGPNPEFMSRQAIINGNFDVWQRGTSFTITGSTFAYYDADRWRESGDSGGGTFPSMVITKQPLISGDISNAFYFHRLNVNGAGTSLGANSSFIAEQSIENGPRYLCGAGKKITLSFYARSSISNKKLAVNITQDYGTGGSPSATEQLVGTVFSLTSTWTKYTFTFTTNTLVGKTFGSNNDDLMRVRFWKVWGTNFISRFGASTEETFVGSGDIDIAQIQVNAGDVALPFQPKTYEDEIITCGNIDDTNAFGYNQTARPSLLTYPVNSMSRQALINGNFNIWQRGTNFANPASNGITADRINVSNIPDGGVMPVTITHSRNSLTSGEVLGSQFFYRINSTGSGSAFGTQALYAIKERVENGTRLLCGAGKKVTISFMARSDIAGKRLGVFMEQRYGTGGSPSGSEQLTGNNFTLTTTFQKYTVTFTTNTLVGKTFGTNFDDYFQIVLANVWGSTYNTIVNSSTTETFVGAGNIDIAQVQVNSGDVALPFQPKTFAQELQDCRRYFEKSGNYSDALGFGSDSRISCNQVANNKFSARLLFNTRKRTIPTTIVYDSAGVINKASWENYGSGVVSLNTSISIADETGFCLSSSATDSTPTTVVNFKYYADAEL